MAAKFLHRRFVRLAVLAAGSAALLIACLGSMPAYVAITPEGPYAMGVTVLDAKLYEREGAETLAPAVEIRYPADSGRWGRQLWKTFVAWYWPGGLDNAPAAQSGGKFPIIFDYSGWPGAGVDNLVLVRELVSRGYAVVTVHYPYGFPGLSQTQLKLRRADLTRDMGFPSEKGFRETVAFCDNRVRDRAKDASAILDALIRLNAQGGMPAGISLDTDHTGIMGFSFGGTVASQARLQDARFKAAINMDGWHFAEAVDGAPPPHIFMLGGDTPYPSAEELDSPEPEKHFEAVLNKREYDQHIASMRRVGGYVLMVPTTDHFNFSDGNFQGTMLRRLLAGSLMHRPGGLGPIDPLRAYGITSSYALAFFETYLKDRPSPLLDPSHAPFPEAQLQAWPDRRNTSVLQPR
jgi:predicted dienelactone hydrolase